MVSADFQRISKISVSQARNSQRLCKAHAQLSQHCECVNITYLELLTYVWYRDSCSYIGPQNFMGHDNTPFGHGVSHQPAIWLVGEFGLGGVGILGLALHPSHNPPIGFNDIPFICRAECVTEVAVCPFGKFIFPFFQFLPHPVLLSIAPSSA